MKNRFKIPLVIVLLTYFLCGFSQNADFYKYKIKYWEKKGQNGKIMTFIGAPIAIIGITFFSLGLHYSSEAERFLSIGDEVSADRFDTKGATFGLSGYALGIAGLGITIPGIINWSLSSRKIEEYRIKLDGTKTGVFFAPSQLSVKIAFRF